MRWPAVPVSAKATALTMLVAAGGALLFWLVRAPVYALLGPAVLVSLAGLAGLRTAIAPELRDVCFVVLGITVGAGFNADAVAAMQRWPLAFLFMALTIWLIMVISRALLVRFFDFDARSALLASAPGHLSFVIAAASETGADVARISITQSVRLLALTLLVPFAALLLGVDVTGSIAPQGQPMTLLTLLLTGVAAIAAGLIFARLSVPAPLLMGAMAVSAGAQLSGLSDAVMPFWLVVPAYVVMGALIGTRFNGIDPAVFVRGFAAGVSATMVAVALSALAAFPVALSLGMPMAHVLVAFAPGGLETMIAMGVVLGVVPGFVAACHIARLLVLTVLLPALLARVTDDTPARPRA